MEKAFGKRKKDDNAIQGLDFKNNLEHSLYFSLLLTGLGSYCMLFAWLLSNLHNSPLPLLPTIFSIRVH